MPAITLTSNDFNQQLIQSQTIIEQRMAEILSGQIQHNQLEDALRYGALAGGKRLRPFLMFASAQLFNQDISNVLETAAALEFIHCSSLIHDDLPAMDDDDLRRGQPTCHIQFDEATAILVGDAFLSLAFEVMSQDTSLTVEKRLKLIHQLTVASGRYGMIGGQMDDIEGEKKSLNLEQIILLQQKKTGALFEYACEAGAIIGNAGANQQQALKQYAKHFGLAFQITDDILDVTGSEAEVGKRLNKDQEAGKETFISLMGLEEAKIYAQKTINQAKQALEIFGDRANILCDLIDMLNNRKS